MTYEIGQKFLVTTNDWFYAPDGEQYKAVYGTITAVQTDDETLGVKTNRGSTNWYIVIGNMIVAGCQIHYCIKTDECSTCPPTVESGDGDKFLAQRGGTSRIYFSD